MEKITKRMAWCSAGSVPRLKSRTPKFTALLKVKELWEVAVCHTEHRSFKISKLETCSAAGNGILGSCRWNTSPSVSAGRCAQTSLGRLGSSTWTSTSSFYVWLLPVDTLIYVKVNTPVSKRGLECAGPVWPLESLEARFQPTQSAYKKKKKLIKTCAKS